MKRVAITGATSMIGVALIEECIKHEIQVLAIIRKGSTRLSRLPKSSYISVIESDLPALSVLDVSGLSCDVFYHFAWDGTVRGPRENIDLQWNNLRYTMDAVNLAHRLNSRVFIGAGSQAEYGINLGKIDANTLVNPLTPYGVAKYSAGRLSAFFCEKYGMKNIYLFDRKQQKNYFNKNGVAIASQWLTYKGNRYYFLANSTIAICIPKQIPRYGTLWALA